MSNAQMGETPLHGAHGAYETTCDIVGLVDPSVFFLKRSVRIPWISCVHNPRLRDRYEGRVLGRQ